MPLDIQIKTYGKFSSDDAQIIHDGTILSKIGLTQDEIVFDVSFDLCIELVSGIKYTGTISLNLPVGDIIKSGTSNIDKTDFSDVIFKRS